MKIKGLCLNCGRVISRYKSAMVGDIFCNYKCLGEWRHKNRKDENSAKYNRINIKCSQCGKILSIIESTIKRQHHFFCDQKCYSDWRIGKFKGDNSPLWKGGRSFGKYCPLFNSKFKQQVRDDYNNRCFMCGKTNDENGRNLDVHHVNYDKDCLCGSPCDFVPLCRVCHAKTNFNRKYWEDLIIHYLYPGQYFMVDI